MISCYCSLSSYIMYLRMVGRQALRRKKHDYRELFACNKTEKRTFVHFSSGRFLMYEHFIIRRLSPQHWIWIIKETWYRKNDASVNIYIYYWLSLVAISANIKFFFKNKGLVNFLCSLYKFPPVLDFNEKSWK